MDKSQASLAEHGRRAERVAAVGPEHRGAEPGRAADAAGDRRADAGAADAGRARHRERAGRQRPGRGADRRRTTSRRRRSSRRRTAPIASLNGAVGQWIGGGPTSSTSSEHEHDHAAARTGSAFITLSDLSAPQVSASISEADIGKIQPGQKATFTLTAFPNRTFTGTVASIQPAGTTTSNVVTYNVLISVDKTDVTLLPSMTATVTIVTQEADNAILVPNAAISYAQTQRRRRPTQRAGQAAVRRCAGNGQAAQGGGQGARRGPGGPGAARRRRVRRGAGAARAPARSALADGGRWRAANAAVFVLRNGQPVRVPIQTGHQRRHRAPSSSAACSLATRS